MTEVTILRTGKPGLTTWPRWTNPEPAARAGRLGRVSGSVHQKPTKVNQVQQEVNRSHLAGPGFIPGIATLLLTRHKFQAPFKVQNTLRLRIDNGIGRKITERLRDLRNSFC
jgi:hypothetical protein